MLIGLGALATAPAAGAAEWQVSTRMRAELEHDGNPGLASAPQPAQTSAAIGGTLEATRRTESELTQLSAEATLHHELRGADERRADGRFVLGHTLNGETGAVVLGAQADADSSDAAAFGSADVLLGDAARRTRQLSAAVQRQLDERWTLQGSVSTASTGYASGAARDFHERGVSLQASFLLDERSSTSLTLGRSAYRRDDGADASDSTSLRLGWTRRWTERATWSLSAGRWQSRRRLQLAVLACPLPEAFCALGLIDPVAVPFTVTASSSGGSGAASFEGALDERSSVAARASRDLVSGGGGVQRSTAYTAALQHAIDPQTDATLRWTRTAAEVPGATASRARLDTLEARLGRALTPDLRIGLGAEQRRGHSAAGGTHGTRLTLTLEATGPRWPR